MFTTKIQTISFSTSVELGQPFNAGLDAYRVNFPASAGIGHELFSVAAVFFSHEAINIMQIDDKGLLNYCKATFLGTTKPALSSSEINVAGKKCYFEKIAKTIPEKSTVLAFVYTLKTGSKVITAFEHNEKYDSTTAEIIFSEIANSFREN